MNVYETKDFYLAAFLMCKGFKFVGSHITPVGVYFHFEYTNRSKLNELIDLFINHQALVNMSKFVKIQGFLRYELDKYRT
jgi:hypothetical protein